MTIIIIIVFQKIVNAAVYEWDRTWKMPFNEAKCLAINFGKVTPVVKIQLGTTCLA